MEFKPKKQYWSNLTELKQLNSTSEEAAAGKGDEFAADDVLSENGFSSDRRDFLKVLGFSVTTAALAASCEAPVRKAIPYLIKPEDITPGIATYYASTFINGSDWCPVLVKTREGRPIKIEPNHWSSVSQGAMDIKAVASVLGLYSTNRLNGPRSKTGDSWNRISMSEADKAISGKFAANPEARIAILSETVISPSTQKAISRFKEAYPNAWHVQYDPVSASGLLDANAAMYGKRAFPDYKFENTDVVVSFSADYLGSWGSYLEYQKGWGKRRKLDPKRPSMMRTYQFESRMSRSGANADYRTPLQEKMVGAALVHLHNRIAASTNGTSVSGAPALSGEAEKHVSKAAIDLLAARGKSIVLCGSNDVNAQMLTNSINEMLGNYGSTISWDSPVLLKKGNDAELADLMGRMTAGEVDTLIVYNCNPAYNVNGFAEAMANLPLVICTNRTVDETAELSNFLTPDSHYLESWNDAEPKAGHYSLCQPTIKTMFDTREAQHSLLAWAGYTGSWYDFLSQHWTNDILSESLSARSAWTKALQTGGYDSVNHSNLAGEDENVVADAAAAASAGAKFVQHISSSSGAIEITAFENPVIGNGEYTSNPWLQETPDPITKITWDNYAMVNPGWGRENGLEDGDMIRLSSGAGSVEVPVKLQPGQVKGSVSVAVGYGRTATGNKETNNGGNAYALIAADRSGVTGGTWEAIEGKVEFAANQDYDSLFDDVNRRPIVKEATLTEYKKDRMAGNRDRLEVLHHLNSFYPDRFANKNGFHWGMAVDLNSCIGCGACHVSCQSENNIPVVGKTEIRRKHDMHWIRIDRYYAGTEDNPEVVFQPMMCQHCDQAPCENVCPVAATNHSSEGLNQMAYNRCIGTRYCANNCPYKVRRFNWFDYMGADSFGAFNDKDVMATEGKGGMLSDLTRMVLNPDVTVRSRGVMEKCSFCVQRIQDAKLSAKKEGRQMRDGEIVTACQAACTTGAISFGNLYDENSEVHMLSEKNDRAFRVIEEFHTLPSVTYLTKIRNKEIGDHVYEDVFEGTMSKKQRAKHNV